MSIAKAIPAERGSMRGRRVPGATFADAFWNRVKKTGDDGCWLWQGARTKTGYGMVYADGKRYYAHRVSHQMEHGTIGDSVSVLHHCDNPPCVRPDHLFAGTQADNVRDMVRKSRGKNQSFGKTHCKHGHVFDLANTRIDRSGYRVCIICSRLKQERQRRAKGIIPRDQYQPLRKGFCVRGHPLSENNLRILKRVRSGHTTIEHICRECVRIRNRKTKPSQRDQMGIRP